MRWRWLVLLAGMNVANAANEGPWFVINEGACQEANDSPADYVGASKRGRDIFGVKVSMHDLMKEGGKVVVVAVTLDIADVKQNSVYVRGEARCQAVLEEALRQRSREADPYR